ncbi:MAG: HAD-IA family hydrolase [Candidatus Binatia bacterium]
MKDKPIAISSYSGKNDMALKAIFFDAAGTLFTSVRPVGESYALMAKGYGMEVSGAETARRFRSCFSLAPPLAFPGASGEHIKELERSWWKELVRKIFEPFGPFVRFDEYFSELFGYFSKADSWSLCDNTVETLLALRSKKLTLGVISNFESRLFGILNGLGIASHFDSVLISSQVGYAKPSAEIFQAALILHRLRPEEAMFVGDSPETDITGATRAGLEAVLLDPGARGETDSTLRIRNLKEILSLIDR